MNIYTLIKIIAVSLTTTVFAMNALATDNPYNNPVPNKGQLIHKSPTMQELEAADLHPELKRVIRRGYDLFMNTQQLRGENVFNSMNCSSCHMGEGRQAFAGPLWPAVVTLPDYRGKNNHVNNLEERIVGCFSYSMNGIPPAYGSDNMIALTTYMQWLASGAVMYPSNKNIYGRGYGSLAKPAQAPDYQRGKVAYAEHCSICHGNNGEGVVQGDHVVFPAVWGNTSYNWGAGMVRPNTLAGFIRHNMPLGQGNTMSEQQSWDIAYFINSQDRPQDPRFTGDVKDTRKKEEVFHKNSNYGLVVDGRLLGEKSTKGEKPILKPELLKPRSYTAN